MVQIYSCQNFKNQSSVWWLSFSFIVILFLIIHVPHNVYAQSRLKKPNVVIIQAADLGIADIGCYSLEKVKTPNIDKLAKEGARFVNFYSMPSASPSAASLLTGAYPHRTGITTNLGPKGSDWTEPVYNSGISEAHITLAELVKPGGYATCMVGVWQLGSQKQFLPTRHGFDEFFGLPYPFNLSKQFHKQWGDLPLYNNDSVIENNPDLSKLSARFTNRAIEFITQKSSGQFLLYYSHMMPHAPIITEKEFEGTVKGKPFYDGLAELDFTVGQIVKTLQKLNIDKQTIIIFTSSNGPDIMFGNHAGSTAGFREGANTAFEGGVRVPFLFRYPDRSPGNNITTEVGSLIDIFPTIANLTRNPLPSAKIDGIDLWPVLSGMETLLRARKAYLYYLGEQIVAVRQGNWKLYLPHQYISLTETGQNGQSGKQELRSQELALYDLENDPSETNNLALNNRDLVLKLKSIIEAFKNEVDKSK